MSSFNIPNLHVKKRATDLQTTRPVERWLRIQMKMNSKVEVTGISNYSGPYRVSPIGIAFEGKINVKDGRQPVCKSNSTPAVIVGLDCATGLQTVRVLNGYGIPVIGIADNPRFIGTT